MPPLTRTQARTELERQLDACTAALYHVEDRLERAERRCELRQEEILILRRDQNRLIRERDQYVEQAKTTSRQYNRLLQQYKHHESFSGTFDDQMQEKNDEIARLQEEIQRYKATITKSTRIHGQLSDTKIQTKMNDLFSAVRNWAVEVARREKPVGVLKPTHQRMAELLHKQLPGFQSDDSTGKTYALVAVFASVLEKLVNENWICGVEPEGPLALAKDLYNLVSTDSMAAQQRKTQWVLLTRELLQGEHTIGDQADKQIVSVLLEHMQRSLGMLSSTLEVQVIVNELRVAIEPHIDIVQVLYQQEAEYSLKLEEAVDGDALRKIDLSIMQEVNGEDEGEISACFFPMLIKKTFENDVKGESVIVCKMKVLALS